MAIALYFSPSPAMTAQQYDECTKRLKKAGAGHPPGRVYHACFGTGESVNIFDVWTSQGAFDKFGRTLMPILNDLGVNPGEPRVMDVRKVIVPPSRARSAAKGRPAARRAGTKPKKSRKPRRRARR